MSKTSFVRQMGHSLTDDLTAPEAFWTPTDSSLHPQTHIHPRIFIVPYNAVFCTAVFSSTRPCMSQSNPGVCISAPLFHLSVFMTKWHCKYIYTSFHREQQRSLKTPTSEDKKSSDRATQRGPSRVKVRQWGSRRCVHMDFPVKATQLCSQS